MIAGEMTPLHAFVCLRKMGQDPERFIAACAKHGYPHDADAIRAFCALHREHDLFDGDTAFKLIATHGFPREILEEEVQNSGQVLDSIRLNILLAEHRNKSRAAAPERRVF